MRNAPETFRHVRFEVDRHGQGWLILGKPIDGDLVAPDLCEGQAERVRISRDDLLGLRDQLADMLGRLKPAPSKYRSIDDN
jgi:hypothetical protein